MQQIIATIIVLLFSATALASSEPDTVTKIEALRLAYELNGRSMVRWGSIDLSGPPPGPLPKSDRVIPLKKERK
jgi:hypothetical protein